MVGQVICEFAMYLLPDCPGRRQHSTRVPLEAISAPLPPDGNRWPGKAQRTHGGRLRPMANDP